MKILYDYQIFQMQNFGGISRYFFELMNNSSTAGFDYDLSLLFSSNEYLFESNKGLSGILKVPQNLSSEFYRFTNAINLQCSKLKIKSENFDVFHPTFYEDYFIEKIKKPYVITVYDLINERFPQYFKANEEFINRKKRLMENATRIIAISENTKKDIVEYFNIDPAKIDITYLAESLSPVKSLKVENLPGRYLLFVGKRGGYKNFENMYNGIKDFLIADQDLYLVCAGGGNFSSAEKERFVQDKVDHKIKYVTFTKNEELKYLYENAVCFIFPSLYEGFGIPVLESFASGCVICTSYSSSLMEIGGKAALYFDPNSSDEIKTTVRKALGLRRENEYVDAGFKELEKYSWKKTTEQTLEVYKNVRG